MRMKVQNKILKYRGFNLIEIVVTVAIIGFFTAIILPNLTDARARSRDAVRADDLKSLAQASELYFAEHGYEFPNDITDLSSYYTNNVLPKDPKTDSNYVYIKTSTPKGFCIGTNMETEMTNGSDCAVPGTNYTIKGP